LSALPDLLLRNEAAATDSILGLFLEEIECPI